MSGVADRLARLSPERRAALQELLRQQPAAPAELPLVALPRDGSPLPLSFAQRRLWFIDQLEPGSAAYNVPYALRLRGRFDPAVLERAVTEIVRRHETLRTVFAVVDGEPVQVIRDAGPVILPVTDLRSLPAESREVEVRRLARDEAVRPFDLAAGPLLRASTLRLDEAEWGLLFTMHHVVSDGWSMGVLVREVSALYGAIADGREAELPELPVQYADYAAWQRAWLTGETLEARLDYWRDRLAGAPPLLELPTDRPRSQAQDPREASVGVHLAADVSAGLRALSRREGATAFMTLLAAWQLLLSRYSGQEDVSVGTPIAGRTRLETEPLIGYVVTTRVLRTDLSGEPTFRELLGRVRETTLGAYQHQEIPFERLVEELAPERNLAHSPLFQAMFVMQNNERGELRMGALEMEPLAAVGEEIAKFDLTLSLAEDEQGFAGSLSYRTGLWDEATLERIAVHFRALLARVVAEPARPLAHLEVLDAAERDQLLGQWSGSQRRAEPLVCVHEAFAEQAARTPDAVALLYQDRALSYAELERAANRLAHRLTRLGVRPDVRVGICVERSPELVVGLLGILKAGGAYVPLDPQYPTERLAFMLADADAPVLLTQERLGARFPEFAGSVVLLDREAAQVAGESEAAPQVRVTPEHLAYVIYTSGSTGQPKGTEVPHRAIPGFFRGVDYARFDAEVVLLQHASVSWDVLTLELWPALLSGGRCVLYPGAASEPGLLGEQVREHGVNTLWLTAAYFNLIVDTTPEVLAGVAQVMTGGEAVSAAHVRRALELYPELRLVNGYGPSECTVFASCYAVPADFDAPSVPVGRPIGDRRVYLLDASLAPVPQGAPGEVCIGGPSVGRGYLNRAELTA
ncbi:MAG TPA: condensation domain-containing protein, partial [Longimicrobiaceae bacterium]|nr:condensation domain-containing protein [Longimicrobiaceae bacterium]